MMQYVHRLAGIEPTREEYQFTQDIMDYTVGVSTQYDISLYITYSLQGLFPNIFNYGIVHI